MCAGALGRPRERPRIPGAWIVPRGRRTPAISPIHADSGKTLCRGERPGSERRGGPKRLGLPIKPQLW